jgi:hypothetical protein
MKKNIFIITTLSIFIVAAMNKSFGAKYYIDPSSTKETCIGTLKYPWKSISQLNKNARYIKAGDVVHFKRGQFFSGQIEIINSGIIGKTITYTNYGLGNLPIFNSCAFTAISIVNKNFIIIDGIKIIDNTLINDVFHLTTANVKYAITLDSSSNCEIINCDISLVATGVNVLEGSLNTTISRNYIHNLRMSINTAKEFNSDDDCGANSVVVASSNNTIAYNKFEDCWAKSSDYGFDGGAIEFFGNNITNNKILYNTAVNCDGFIEIGSSKKGVCEDNIIAYNKIINCGVLGVFHNSGPFLIRMCNLQFYNNIDVETKMQFNRSSVMLWMSGNGENGAIILKNNIFWLSSGVNFAQRKFSDGKMIHDHNIFRMERGDLGIKINENEFFSRSARLFLTDEGQPLLWNFILLPKSLARNFGTPVGIEKDFYGKKISSKPNAGLSE